MTKAPTLPGRYRQGGWYTSVRYPSGASGCVARGIGGGWAVACVPELGEYETALEAARAEAVYVTGLHTAGVS